MSYLLVMMIKKEKNFMYNVSINGEKVLSELSLGELRQSILDFDKEIKESHHRSAFRDGFGYHTESESNEISFEDFIYSEDFKLPVYSTLRGDIFAVVLEDA